MEVAMGPTELQAALGAGPGLAMETMVAEIWRKLELGRIAFDHPLYPSA
jgi:hypothetical protein